MQIQATKKLLDKLPFEKVEATEGNPLYDWHANLLTIDRRQTVVLMNDLTRYAVVLYGVKAKDFKRFDELVKEAIREVFLKERFSPKVVDWYIDELGAVTFHKTKNRSMTAQLNKAVDHVWLFADQLTTESLVNVSVGKHASRLLVGRGNNKMDEPYDALVDALKGIAEGALFQTNVVQLKVTLNLESHSIWRRLMVPLDLSFADFHEVLQIAFNWHDSHLHDYYFHDPKDEEKVIEGGLMRPKVNIVMNEESFYYGIEGVEMMMEDGLVLADFIPKHRYIKYVYDFGDDWQHDIVVEDVLLGQNISAPSCTDWEGIAPPEDCGGEFGFNEFLAIINDETHPEHREMTHWGWMQGYRSFSLDRVNRQLSRL